MKRLALAIVLSVAVGASTLSCKVNEYCLNCATGDGGNGDGGDGDGGVDDGGDGDGGDGDAGPCTTPATEVCDGKDNDCDNKTDEGPLPPPVGQQCQNQTGECAGAVNECVNGAVVCSRRPSPESCDRLDNNCNGLTDEGDPGGGASCGTNVGECVAGTFHCNLATGVVECVGAVGTPGGQSETCNGLDDDCDGTVDDGIGPLGPCPTGTDTGECTRGTLMCVGGGAVCTGEQGPTFEACDLKDNDCDTRADEDYNKQTDPLNCGACGTVCNLPNAIEGCAGGMCTVAACADGYHNNNGNPADGCEFGPCQIQGNEVCNGVDDDCDGLTDENQVPPAGFCRTAGECAGATASCTGAGGFRCDYGPTVSQDANGNVIPENRCDDLDNDCDVAIDEGQPNKDDACDNGGTGVCRGTGTFECNTANPTGPAVCVITAPGQPSSPETCDALDNDCDGLVDDGANTGNLPGQEWVTIPGSTVQIMKYEASRPGATATGVGTNQTFACSKPTVQPWANVTYPQAVAACSSIGARLCSESEWQSMCDPIPTFPLASPTGASDYLYMEAEHGTRFGGNGHAWTNDQLSDFSGTTDLMATPVAGGQSQGCGNGSSDEARVDFPINFSAGNYFVWVRMFASSGSDNSVCVGINTTAGSGSNGTELSLGTNNAWRWVRSPSFGIGADGVRTISVFMREDGTRIDTIALSRDGTNPPSADRRTWAFDANPKTPQPQVCNGDEFDTGAAAGDQDDILATGARNACYANGTGGADAYDMSGNVKEWAQARLPGQNPLRGGSANNEVDGLTCGLDFTLADDTFFFPNVGFRCCR